MLPGQPAPIDHQHSTGFTGVLVLGRVFTCESHAFASLPGDGSAVCMVRDVSLG